MNEPATPSEWESSNVAGHEATDASPSLISVSAAALLLVVGIVLALLASTLRSFDAAIARRDAPASPFQQNQAPPEPRLQPDPAAELAQWRDAQVRQRTTYGHIAGEPRFVRIPVDRAITILAKRGFPEPEGKWEPRPGQGGKR